MKHIAIIYGTRPQVIKLAPLVKELDKHKELTYTLINTGQHYDENMDGVFYKQLGIRNPDYNASDLTISPTLSSYPSGRLGEFVMAITQFLLQLSPDLAIVIGDTDSTLAGALAAKKMAIPVAHIEAGVRSGDRSQPEEINRILVDEMSDMHFCPDNRLRYLESSLYQWRCDLMLDAFLMYKDKAVCGADVILDAGEFNLLTLHRANLTWDFVLEVIRAVEFIGKPTLWPVHPRVKNMIPEGYDFPDNLIDIPPQGYFEMLWLVQNAEHILTDSGGLVREAGFADKPYTILRTESEWKGVTLKDYSALAILTAINTSTDGYINHIKYLWHNVHGNGKASETIVKAIKRYLNIQDES